MPASQDLEDIKKAHPLLFVSEEPDVGEMQKEFERAGGLSVSGFHRERNDRIRYNRWKGRTADYRKHRRALGKDPVPWEDSADSRVYLADSVIEDLGDVMSSAFERAQLKLKPTEAGDIERTGQAQIVLDKYRERMTPSLRDEALAGLRSLTGFRNRTRQDDWRSWWQSQDKGTNSPASTSLTAP